jgi:hypothetical protein
VAQEAETEKEDGNKRPGEERQQEAEIEEGEKTGVMCCGLANRVYAGSCKTELITC